MALWAAKFCESCKNALRALTPSHACALFPGIRVVETNLVNDVTNPSYCRISPLKLVVLDAEVQVVHQTLQIAAQGAMVELVLHGFDLSLGSRHLLALAPYCLVKLL